MSSLAIHYRALPIAERIELVEDIWDSIADDTPAAVPLSPAERAELHRRLAEHRANPSSSVPWEQVRSTLFKGHA